MTTQNAVPKADLQAVYDEYAHLATDNLNSANAAAKAAYDKLDGGQALTKADVLAIWRPAYDLCGVLTGLRDDMAGLIGSNGGAQPDDGGTGKPPPPAN